MLGKIVHFSVDAVLVSTVLAGIKRNTGLEPKLSTIESEDVRSYVQKYLNVGDWVLDNSLAYLSNSKYFERKNN
ncbi:unnamed protein product [Cunninghamella blakesleeana]